MTNPGAAPPGGREQIIRGEATGGIDSAPWPRARADGRAHQGAINHIRRRSPPLHANLAAFVDLDPSRWPALRST